MQDLITLPDVSLIPAVELEPDLFATQDRPLPFLSGRESDEDLLRYWLDSLADAGIRGLTPLRPDSWHVPTRQLTDPDVLQRVLAAVIEDWGGLEVLTDPGRNAVLEGGLALVSGGALLAEPTCCVDLGCVADWRKAAEYRGADWRMLWTGHPWLSVRFEGGALILSEPHESNEPAGRWAIRPDLLAQAVAVAEAELEDFARRLVEPLKALGVKEGTGEIARTLAGLNS